MSGIFLLISTLPQVHDGKKSPPPVNLSPVKVTRMVDATMCWFDWGIKICRTLPLDCLRSAGFLDRRAIFSLAVMGLTGNSATGICNWCLFSIHLRPAYPLAFPTCPLPPFSMGEPCLPVPLPSHYHCTPRGAARALKGEASGSGHNAVFF